MYKISKYNIIKKYDDKIIVYNSYTKASLFLDKNSNTDAFEDIKVFNKLDKDTKKVLIANGFVIDKNRDEFAEIKYIFEKKYYDKTFLNIVLVPSLACNFSCPYCFEKDLKCGKENIKKYFSALKRFAKNNFKDYKCIQISLFGGEPLLFVKNCLQFLNWVKQDSNDKKYDYFTSIVTNGSLLTEEILDELLQNNLKMVQITIDSDKETHDLTRKFKTGKPSFDLLIEKISMIVDKTKSYEDFNFVLRINLSNTTVQKVKESLEHIEPKYRSKVNLLIRSVYNTHAYQDDNDNDNSQIDNYFAIGQELGFSIFQESFQYQSCEACADDKFFYLMPDLSMWKCINDLNYNDACIGQMNEDGSVTTDPMKNVKWSKNAMSQFMDEECINCKKLPDCYGGCILRKCKTCKKQCRPFEMTSMFHTFV
ncbi:MAG: 4Fe-4S cluster-binding domain-containing protein [Bacilli bacterium]|nr:4Fe-4S cluster-binding domain-containing protein [Bacilli bacterium]